MYRIEEEFSEESSEFDFDKIYSEENKDNNIASFSKKFITSKFLKMFSLFAITSMIVVIVILLIKF